MDPNLAQLLWAAYPLACFWYGILCREDIGAGEGFLGGLLIVLAIVGHVVAFAAIIHATLKAFNVIQ